jgi:hypothetical protein
MTFNALQELESAGIPVGNLNDAQRAVVSELSPSEVELVAKINNRLGEASEGQDVEGHVWVGVGVF